LTGCRLPLRNCLSIMHAIGPRVKTAHSQAARSTHLDYTSFGILAQAANFRRWRGPSPSFMRPNTPGGRIRTDDLEGPAPHVLSMNMGIGTSRTEYGFLSTSMRAHRFAPCVRRIAGLTLSLRRPDLSVKGFTRCFTGIELYVAAKRTVAAHTEKLLSIAMENHADGLEHERLTASWFAPAQARFEAFQRMALRLKRNFPRRPP